MSNLLHAYALGLGLGTVLGLGLAYAWGTWIGWRRTRGPNPARGQHLPLELPPAVRSRETRPLGTLVVLLALALLAPPAAADTWRYVTDAGVPSFTDDPKTIPARYRAAATRERDLPLAAYERLTVVEAATPVRARRERAVRLVPAPRAPLDLAEVVEALRAERPVTVRREWRWEAGVNGYSGRSYALFEITRDARTGEVLRDEFVPTGAPASSITIQLEKRPRHHGRREGSGS